MDMKFEKKIKDEPLENEEDIEIKDELLDLKGNEDVEIKDEPLDVKGTEDVDIKDELLEIIENRSDCHSEQVWGEQGLLEHNDQNINTSNDHLSEQIFGLDENKKSKKKISKMTRSSMDSFSSDEDEKVSKVSEIKYSKKLKETEPKEEESSDPSSVSDTEIIIQSGKKSKSNSESSKSKAERTEKNKVKKYQRYLRLIGIRIRNYDTFFKDCKSLEAKRGKMLSLMRQNGLKDRPTIVKCKKLRIKVEVKKEMEELDLDNIIEESGRGRRNVFSLYQTTHKSRIRRPVDDESNSD